jgi:hypothetical protein
MTGVYGAVLLALELAIFATGAYWAPAHRAG